MKTRIISGIIGIAVLLAVIYIGSPVYDIAVLFITLLGLYEFSRAVNHLKTAKIDFTIGYIYAISIPLLSYLGKGDYSRILLFLFIIFSFLQFVFDKDIKTGDLALMILGGLYLVFLLSHLYYFANTYKIWYVFLMASVSDIFAYFVGRFFGKNKLAPILSPKKTVEGFLGGVVAAIIATMIFAKIYDPGYTFKIGMVALICSSISVLGDLFASKIKRETGIKDYGKIMPGHGGVLDRFDSIIFTVPIVFYSFSLIGLI